MVVAGRDHPLREPGRRFLARVRSGEVEGCASTEVLQEMLFRYVGLGRPDLALEVYDLLARLCPVIFPVTVADTDRTRDLLRDAEGVSVRDVLHSAVMLGNDVTRIASFDRGFDRVPGIQRVRLEGGRRPPVAGPSPELLPACLFPRGQPGSPAAAAEPLRGTRCAA